MLGNLLSASCTHQWLTATATATHTSDFNPAVCTFKNHKTLSECDRRETAASKPCGSRSSRQLLRQLHSYEAIRANCQQLQAGLAAGGSSNRVPAHPPSALGSKGSAAGVPGAKGMPFLLQPCSLATVTLSLPVQLLLL